MKTTNTVARKKSKMRMTMGRKKKTQKQMRLSPTVLLRKVAVRRVMKKMTIGEVINQKSTKQMMAKMRQTILKKRKRMTKKTKRKNKKGRQRKMLKETTLRAKVTKRMETKKVVTKVMKKKMLRTDSCTNHKFAWSNNCI